MHYANTSESDILEAINSAQNYISWENYREGLEEYKKALKMIKYQIGNYASDLKPIYQDMAAAYEKLGDVVEAVKYCKKIFNLAPINLDDKALDTAAVHNQIGNIYYKNNTPKKAVTHYKKSLDIMVKELGYRSKKTAKVMDMLSKAYYDAKNYKKAANCYSQYYSPMMKVLESNPQENIAYNLRLGGYYYHAEVYEEALLHYELAYSTYKRCNQDNVRQFAHINYLHGNAHYHLKNFETAKKYYKKSLSLQKEQDRQTIDIYTALGNIAKRKWQHPKALSWYQKAIAIHNLIEDKSLGQAATIYIGIGDLWERKEKLEKAMDYFKKALNLLKEEAEPDKKQLINAYYSISNCYDQLREYSHAIEYYEKMIAVEKLLLTPDNKVFVERYYYLALLYSKQSNTRKVQKIVMQALYIATLKDFRDNQLISKLYSLLGDIYWETVPAYGDSVTQDLILTPCIHHQKQSTTQYLQPKYSHKERAQICLAIDAYRTAIQKCENHDSTWSSRALPQARMRVARGYSWLRNDVEALKFYKSLSFYIKYIYIEKDSLLTSHVDNELGKIFLQREDYKNATLHFNKALEAAKGDPEDETFLLFKLDLTFNMIINYYHKEKYKQAIQLLEEAKAMSKKLRLDDYLATHDNNLGVVHYANQDYESASDLLEKSLALKLQQSSNCRPLSLLATYHNLAILSQELSEKGKADSYHQKAYQIAKQHLDQEDPMMQYFASQTQEVTVTDPKQEDTDVFDRAKEKRGAF